MTDCDKKEAVI